MSDQTLKMSSSPHIRDNMTTSKIMLMVVIALLPASAFGIYNFGVPALIMLISTTASAVLTEYIYEKLMHKRKHLAPSAGFIKFCPRPPKSCFTIKIPNTLPSAPIHHGAVGGILSPRSSPVTTAL